LAESARRTQSWQAVDLAFAASETVVNKNDINQRLQFVWKRFADVRKEQLLPLMPGFDAIDVDWPRTVPDNARTATTADDWVFDKKLRQAIKLRRARGIDGISLNPTLSVHQLPASKDFVAQLATDPDIVSRSADGHTAEVRGRWWDSFGTMGNLNVNSAAFLEQAERYVSALAQVLKQQRIAPLFLVTTWEGNYPFYIDIKDKNRPGYRQRRLPGYNPSQRRAFSEYLRERYPTIENLNQRWRSDFANFAAIAPPADKHVTPAAEAGGLT
jgi:hypothetical protein